MRRGSDTSPSSRDSGRVLAKVDGALKGRGDEDEY